MVSGYHSKNFSHEKVHVVGLGSHKFNAPHNQDTRKENPPEKAISRLFS